MMKKLLTNQNYLLLIDEEAEIKAGDIAVHDFGMGCDLEIPCDADNLRSNTRRKVVAYYPLISGVKELDLPLLPNPFEEDDLTKLSQKYRDSQYKYIAEGKTKSQAITASLHAQVGFEDGYKAAQPKQFSLEDMKKAIEMAQEEYWNEGGYQGLEYEPEEIIQSLSTQQLPKEFIPEYDEIIVDKLVPKMPIDTIKTITNSEGKQELIGTYKY